ncbi:tetratricopeptide repeat protein [Caldimonas manganoxidans]|uniref:tetratricopeptide repeat protein n=1 Tax=Caldimonas manganoxidans TaxID=196015 RepID=UPI000369C45D|nr:tetratricopeptide repeat protein [Caldimonas manganoxidans]
MPAGLNTPASTAEAPPRAPLLSVSPDDPRRSRLLPRGALLGVGGVCLAVLAIVFPGEGLMRLVERSANHALAIDYLHNLLRLHPGDARLLRLLAERYLAIGEVQRAWDVLQTVEDASAQALRERVALQSWRAARSEGRLEEAERWRGWLLGHLAQRRPTSAEAWIDTLERLHELEALEAESPWLKQAGTWGRRAPSQAQALARRLLGLARPRAAAELLTEAARASTAAAQPALWRAAVQAWLSANEPPRAWHTAQALAARTPVPQADAWLLARLALMTDQPQTAARWLRLALRLHEPERLGTAPTLDEATLEEAWGIFVSAGDHAAALAISDRARRLAPNSTVWAERHARVLEWSGRPQEALALWVQLMRGPVARLAQQRVRALAPGLFDWNALIGYWRTRAATSTLSAEEWRSYIDLLRQQGLSEQAVEVARQAAAQHPALDRVLAALLWNEGHIDDALAAYRRAARGGWLDTEARLEAASAMLIALRLEEAAGLLAPDPPAPTPAALRESYLELRADLAWELGRHQDARRDYERLYREAQSNDAEMSDYRAQRLLTLTRRLDGAAAALRLAPALWLRGASEGLAELWLDVIAEQPSVHTLRQWEQAMAETAVGALVRQRPSLLQRQAAVWRLLGRSERAEPLLRRAHALAPQDVSILTDWVSWLVDQRRWDDLRHTLSEHAQRLERDPEGRLVLTEAVRALGHPAWALRLMRAQLEQRQHDPLWLAAYAEVLEELGQEAQARHARERAWALLRAPRSGTDAPADAAQAARALQAQLLQLRLATGRMSPEQVQALLAGLRERLRLGDLDADSQTQVDASLVHALLAMELDSWADWWLARRTLSGALGAGLRVLRALAHRDVQGVRDHLDPGRAALSPVDQAEAAWAIGQRGSALAALGAQLEAAAARDDDPQRLRSIATLTAERQREQAHQLRLGQTQDTLAGLSIQRTQVQADLAWGERWTLQAHLGQEQLRRRTDSLLAPLPSDLRMGGLSATWHDERWSLGAWWRTHGLGARRNTWGLDTGYRLTDRQRLQLHVALDAPVLDTELLRVAARRHQLQAQWEGSHGRLYASTQLSLARYHTDAGGRLGQASQWRAEAGYWLRRTEPVLAVRGYAAVRRERTDDTPRPELGRWLASGDTGLSGAQVMPGSQDEVGLSVRWGQADGLASRRWWPQLELGLAHSRRNGLVPSASLGWRGPLLGGDEWQLSVQHSQSDTGPSRSVQWQYRHWFDR